MSPSVPSRPLSLVPFLAVDGVLLLTALLIAWRTSGELEGGALLGLIVCVGLGAVLTVLPFVINDARERDAALAERQRELVDLVTSTTATASRWGTQWTAAATGLEDAAGLATRSLAVAERLPAMLQEKVDAFARLLEQAELGAQAREAQVALGARARDERVEQQEAALALRAKQAGTAVAELERTLACFDRINTDLREQHAALAATLAEFPAAAARAQAAREILDERLAAAPAQIETQIEARITRLATDAEARLAATTDALTLRLAGLETALGSLTEQLERVKTLELPVAPPAMTPVVAPEPTMPEPVPEPTVEPERVSEAPAITVCEAAGKAVPVPVVGEAAVPKPVREEPIMDPFYIPSDGYSALADAMDAGRSR